MCQSYHILSWPQNLFTPLTQLCQHKSSLSASSVRFIFLNFIIRVWFNLEDQSIKITTSRNAILTDWSFSTHIIRLTFRYLRIPFSLNDSSHSQGSHSKYGAGHSFTMTIAKTAHSKNCLFIFKKIRFFLCLSRSFHFVPNERFATTHFFNIIKVPI